MRTNTRCLPIIIETPKGTGEKYDYDKKLGCFKLKKLLPAGMVFPFDFGFIPGTKGEDGDPLDIIVISEVKTFTGCAIDCRLIGAIKAKQTEENGKKIRNDRFIGIPVVSEMYKETFSIKDLPKEIIRQLEDFFRNYNKEEKKQFEVIGLVDVKKAWKMIA